MPTEIERLYREHRAGLVRLVERELRDHQDAEDVVQAAFLDAQRALERGTIPRNPRAWLAAIALNAAHRLRRRRVKAEPLEEYAAREASAVSELRDALAGLPKEQRAAVLYRDVLGLSYGETAEQMGTSVNAVNMLLHRGRQRLRQTLGIAVGGLGVWRWSRRVVGMPQVAVVKAATVVVAAAGLATTGIVAAGAVARGATDTTTAAPAKRVGSPIAVAGWTPRTSPVLQAAPAHFTSAGGSTAGAAPASGRASAAGAAAAPVRSSTAELPSSSLPKVRLPAVSLPRLPISTSPVTVTVGTPVTTVTVATPTATTATVTTPVTTITLPIP